MTDANSVATGKLYYEEPYAREFKANIVSLEGADAVLDRTLFFPEEGGQSPDRGTLAGYAVTDVRINDGVIHHMLDLPADHDLKAGDEVRGVIDWDHRFSNMQQHSGEHLLSGIVCSMKGYDNVGFHLSDTEVTVDFSGPLTDDELDIIEKKANEAVWADIPSEIRFLSGPEKENFPYRSKIDIPGDVRVVTFPGIDSCACCAPHVRRTGEIGIIKIISAVSWKGGVRLSILCGRRALALIADEHRILTDTARHLTTSADQVIPRIKKMQDESAALSRAGRRLGSELMDLKIAKALERSGGDVCIFLDGADPASAREAVTKAAEMTSGLAAVFLGNDESGYTFTAASKGDDCAAFVAAMRTRLAAKGGGKAGFAQGSVPASMADIEAVLNDFR